MDPIVVKLSTFVAAVLAVVGVFSVISDLILRDKARIKARFDQEFGDERQRLARKSELFKDLKLFHAQTSRHVPVLWKRFVTTVEHSGLNTTPFRVVQIALTAAIIGMVIGATLTGLWLVGIVFALAGMVAPLAYVYAAHASRMHTICMQLPEAFDLMARAIKAGQTMSGAMQIAADQLKPPISAELAACCEQQNLGLPFDVAMQELARRTGVMELQMFVVALLVNRNTGGNLADILQNLSDVIRKRTRLRGKIKAATSEGRLQAVVLSLLPLVVLVGLVLINRPYAQILLDRPALLCAVLASEALGSLWIRQIVNFEH
ncbi:MAG TPA: type II secretion system F family protein [Planctomycetaceae bacterium]|nr:type II secretion system F family protein [Planctomycetaceae bacterium]